MKQKQDLPSDLSNPSGSLSELIPSTVITSANAKFLATLEEGGEPRGLNLSLTPAQGMKSVNEWQCVVLLFQYDCTVHHSFLPANSTGSSIRQT